MVQCDEIAAEAAKRAWGQGARPIVLPTVPFGVNTGQLDVKLDINMNPSTQLAVLSDVVAALERQGIDRLLIMNGHGGNDFRQMVRELLPQHSRCLFAVWTGSPLWKRGFLSGEETMQTRWRPASCSICVQSGSCRSIRPVSVESMHLKWALREGWAWTRSDWLKATDDTGIGDPSLSTPEKGQRCLEQVAGRMASFLVELSVADLDDLYED